ncbi:hypothetical protein GDO78_010548 [Eleutherodactylus coqui]|uniref:Uncharacterized protein n=1 Tax=Eleutherodactylus coqui TaxID=57060 RepID=A0A8J6F4G9_ELECQ|nr:hypothetical protein GDO78_010548 [Eleutherodactylus coqui]
MPSPKRKLHQLHSTCDPGEVECTGLYRLVSCIYGLFDEVHMTSKNSKILKNVKENVDDTSRILHPLTSNRYVSVESLQQYNNTL